MEKLQYALDLFWDDMVGTVEQIDENVYSIAFYTLIDSHWDCIEVYLEKVTDYNYMITDGGNIISDLEMYGFDMANKEDISRIKDILMPPILFDVKEKEFYAVVGTREDDGEGFEDLKKFMFKVYSFARTMSFIHQHFYYLKKKF